MNKFKISIRKSAFFILLAIATLTMFSISALWVVTEIIKSKKKLAEISEFYEADQCEIIKSEVTNVVSLINYSRKYNNNNKSKNELQNEILDFVSKIRLNHGGYIFINTYDGRALIFDGVKIIGEKNIRDITDPDGLKIFDIELNTINNPTGGYFKYKFKRLDTFKPVPKLSYVYGYKDWEWIIGAGVYLDDLNLIIQDRKNQHYAALFKKVLYIIILFVVLLLVLIGVTMILHGLIKKEFDVFMSFFSKTPKEDAFIERNKLNVEEFIELAHSANIMIKQRRVSEKLLKKERDNARKYLDIADVIILALDTKGIVTLINKKGCKTLGFNEEAILGKSWFSNFIPLAEKQNLHTRFLKVISGDNNLAFENYESKIITRSGQEKIILWKNTLLYDSNGLITGSLSSGKDVTKIKTVEDSYFESEEKYKLLFDKTSDPVLLIGRNNTFIDCNDATLTILKLEKKEDLIGTHPNTISPVLQPDGSLSITKASENIANARREGFFRFEWLHINKNKETFHVDVSLTSIPISGVDYLHVVWRDISEKKKQDQELLIAKEKAEQSDDIKTSFLHNIQHEIRTPLNAMMGFSQLLKNESIDKKESEEYFDAIIKSGAMLNKIIDEIIDFSRLQAGIIFLKNDITELKKLLSDIYKDHFLNFQNKQVKFKFNVCPSNNNTIINIDIERIKQVIGYLIDNALKFTEKGAVEIGYTISNNNVTFCVTDTGVGIEKKNYKTIFEKFNRLTHKHSEKIYGGSGLGLSISKTILDYIGGKIWVESEVDRGSKFLFTVPYKPLEISEEIQKHWMDGCIITIVTNKNAEFNLISKVLKNSGVNLIHIKSSMDAIKYCQDNYSTDLMIIDVNLTGMNGITATKAIKAFRKELPIIAMITHGQKELTKEAALIAGCNDYFSLTDSKKTIWLTLAQYINKSMFANTEMS